MLQRTLPACALLLGACGSLDPALIFDEGLAPVAETECLNIQPSEGWSATPVSVADWARGAGDFVTARYPGLMSSGPSGVLRVSSPHASAIVELPDAGVLAAIDRQIVRLDLDLPCGPTAGQVLDLFADDAGTLVATWDETSGTFGEAYLLSSGVDCQVWNEKWRASSRQFESPARLSDTVLFIEVDVRRASRLLALRPGSSPVALSGVEQPRAVRVFRGAFWVFVENAIVVLTPDLQELARYDLPWAFRHAAASSERILIATAGAILEVTGLDPPRVLNSYGRSIQGVGTNLGGWYTGDGLLRRLDDDTPLQALGTPLGWVSLVGSGPVVRPPFALPQAWDPIGKHWLDAVPREPVVEVGGLLEVVPVSNSEFLGLGNRQIWLFETGGRRTYFGELDKSPVITSEDTPFVVQGMSSGCRSSSELVVANRADTRLLWRDTAWHLTRVPVSGPQCVAVRGSTFAVCHRNGMTIVSYDWGNHWESTPGVPWIDATGKIQLLPYPRPDPTRVIPAVGGALLEYSDQVVFVSPAGEHFVGRGALMAVEDQWVYINQEEGVRAVRFR